MIITMLCEPRSGSSNLLFWFGQSNKFTLLFEPFNNPEYKKYSSSGIKINDIDDINNWEYNTEHLVIKEICNPNRDYYDILNKSDKRIILVRENKKEQVESWLTAHNTKSWGGNYVFNEDILVDKNHDFLKLINENIKQYINSDNFFITYEELYYNNGINKIIEYIGLDEIKNLKFPYGVKYRQNKKIL